MEHKPARDLGIDLDVLLGDNSEESVRRLLVISWVQPGSKAQGGRGVRISLFQAHVRDQQTRLHKQPYPIDVSYVPGLQKISDCSSNASESMWMLIWLLPALLQSHRPSLFYCTFVCLSEARVKQPAGTK